MNNLTTELKSLHEATLNNLKSSKANNTLRAYKSDFKDFGAFCTKHSLIPRNQQFYKISEPLSSPVGKCAAKKKNVVLALFC